MWVVSAVAQEPLLIQLGMFLQSELAHLGEEIHTDISAPAAHSLPCDAASPFLAPGAKPLSGRVILGVRCGASAGQVLYLPAQVRITGRYLVAARDIAAGERLSDSDVRWERGDLTAFNGNAITAKLASGTVARQRLTSGTPLQARHLRTEALIQRGEQVTVESRGRGFMVTRQGEALAAGALGEEIAVRLDRHRQVKGRVSGRGRVAALP